jgi:hypothetical protein
METGSCHDAANFPRNFVEAEMICKFSQASTSPNDLGHSLASHQRLLEMPKSKQTFGT